LVGAGAFLLALGVLVQTLVAPGIVKAPAKIDLVTHSRSAAQQLNSATGKLEPIQVDLTRTLSTHADAEQQFTGTANTGVYNDLLSLARVGADGEVQTVDARGRYIGLRAQSLVVAFDRKTGEGRPGILGDTYGTAGQTVKFPFDTQKTTYPYFDQPSLRAWPVTYTRTTTVKGLEVYEFKGTIPQVELGQFGALEGTETLYSNNGRTVLVEPVTGSIVSSTTAPQTSIRFANGSVVPALLIDSLVPTDATISERVSYAKGSKRLALAMSRAPWVLGALGLVMLAFGLWGRRRRVAETIPTRPMRTIDLTTPSEVTAPAVIDLNEPVPAPRQEAKHSRRVQR
jgi:hypothetical protein